MIALPTFMVFLEAIHAGADPALARLVADDFHERIRSIDTTDFDGLVDALYASFEAFGLRLGKVKGGLYG